MEPERRGRVIGSSSRANPTGEERAVTVKPFDISETVGMACLAARASKSWSRRRG